MMTVDYVGGSVGGQKENIETRPDGVGGGGVAPARHVGG